MLDIRVISTSAFAQNCRLISDTAGNAIFVDPGSNGTDLAALAKKRNLKVKSILCTHGQHAHSGGAPALALALGVKIRGPLAADAPLFDAIPLQARAFGLPECTHFRPEFLTDRQIIEVLPGITFEVIAAPGHTPGHVCFYCAQEKFLLCGDVLFQGSIGRTDFPGGSFDDLEQAIKERLYVLPDDTAVLCGHGPDTTIGEEKLYNPFVRP